jgi:hypothetical protein
VGVTKGVICVTNWTFFPLIGLLVFFSLFLFWRQRKSHINQLVPKSEILDAIRIPDYHQALPALNKEHARARRHGHPLSIIVAQVKAATQPKEVVSRVSNSSKSDNSVSNNLNSCELLLCGPVFRDAVREFDITTYDGLNNRFIIALPESNKEQTFKAVHRFNRILGDDIATRLSMGVAEFPTDALFVNELIDIAANNQPIDRKIRQSNASKTIHSVT